MSDAIRDLLRESKARGYVQVGFVTNIKPIKTKDGKVEIVEINFKGVSVYCPKEEFTKRKVSSLGGFMNTPVPFVVTDIIEDANVISVSRVKALPIKVREFQNNVRIGDIQKAIVTGVTSSNTVYVDINGMPAMIRSGDWGLQTIRNLNEVVHIGTEIDVVITDITPVEGDDDWEFGVKIFCSRRAVLAAIQDDRWERIDEVHTVGESVVAKVVKKLDGANNYLVQIVSSQIILYANLQRNLADQYRFGLPQGLIVHALIVKLSKESKRGKARIYRVDPSYRDAEMGRYGSI